MGQSCEISFPAEKFHEADSDGNFAKLSTTFIEIFPDQAINYEIVEVDSSGLAIYKLTESPHIYYRRNSDKNCDLNLELSLV